jgi:hypothetical protein
LLLLRLLIAFVDGPCNCRWLYLSLLLSTADDDVANCCP